MVTTITNQDTTSEIPPRGQPNDELLLVDHVVEYVEARVGGAVTSRESRRRHFEKLRDFYEGQIVRLSGRPELPHDARRAIQHCQERVLEIAETLSAIDRVMVVEVRQVIHDIELVRRTGVRARQGRVAA